MVLPAVAMAAPHATLTQNKAITVFHGQSGRQSLPRWNPPAGSIKIFDTLGPKPYNYDSGSGWTISNPGSETGSQQWFAYAVTPKKSATVTDIVEAVSYVAGTEAVTIALLADDNGTPGAVLEEKTVKKLETFGSCCVVAVDHVKSGIQVTKGTTYWVAAILPAKKEATTWDAWNFSTYNTGAGLGAFYNGTWNVGQQTYAAFAIYGQ